MRVAVITCDCCGKKLKASDVYEVEAIFKSSNTRRVLQEFIGYVFWSRKKEFCLTCLKDVSEKVRKEFCCE